MTPTTINNNRVRAIDRYAYQHTTCYRTSVKCGNLYLKLSIRNDDYRD